MSSEPKTAAVLGASRSRGKFGNKSLRAHRQAGYQVFPVHPSESEVEGEKAYPTLADIPGDLDRITVYLPPPVTLSLLDEIAARGAGEVWLNPGSWDSQVVAAAEEKGIPVRTACSIVDLGLSPAQFP